jgi:glycosyltransferase involved in cell wall biosynthesis
MRQVPRHHPEPRRQAARVDYQRQGSLFIVPARQHRWCSVKPTGAVSIQGGRFARALSMMPLISCIMPTCNRRRFMVQTLKLFEQQDYAQKELIVIDDGDDPVVDLIPADARIRYVRVPERMSIGAKRNLAVSIARGDLICHWDDDDFFGCHRLSRQVEPILKGKAECSGMRMSLLLRTADATLWGCTDQEHDRLFGHGVRCGTLLYPASYWREGLCYEDRNCGEDAHYRDGLLARGASLAQVVDPRSYVCVRHSANITNDIAGMHPPDWWQIELSDYFSEEDRVFYEGLARRSES